MPVGDDQPMMPRQENEKWLRTEHPEPKYSFARTLALADWNVFLWIRRDRPLA